MQRVFDESMKNEKKTSKKLLRKIKFGHALLDEFFDFQKYKKAKVRLVHNTENFIAIQSVPDCYKKFQRKLCEIQQDLFTVFGSTVYTGVAEVSGKSVVF